MRDWWRSLERAPESLSPRQRLAVIAATVAAAVSRIFALARTPWDWDELLFMQALDHFDVAKHRPHPPGFPLYILAAKVIRKSGIGDFHALQVLSLLGAVVIVPAMFFLCRELRMRFSTALSASLLLAFFPNVWFYGGAAFSDVPAMVLIVTSIALLLAGCRDGRAYLGGAVLLGISAGFRPQALLIGCTPMLIATWFQLRRSIARVAIAVAAIVAIAAISYGAAAWLTGWTQYREALALHRDYIARIDSFRSAVRPPLWRVFDDFFVMPYHAPPINAILAVLALISTVASLVRRRAAVLTALAAFGPFCIFAWLILDRFSASRFSIAYAPLIAILVADALALISRRAAIELACSGAIVAMMIVWTWPALREVRSVAPPVAAVDWIRNHADPRVSVIYVDIRMIPFAEWYLPEYRLRFLSESAPPAGWTIRQPGYYLREGGSPVAHAENFVRPSGRLWDVARRRYFEVSVRPIAEAVAFGDGWYSEEGSGAQAWRWMGARAHAALPPINGDAYLTLALYVPLDALPSPPDVIIRLNGAIVDQFRASANRVERKVAVRARGDTTNDLLIETDRVVTPAAQHRGGDRRTLGLRLNSIGWMPAR